MTRLAASLLVALLAFTPAITACDQDCVPQSALAAVAMTSQADCGHGEAGPASPRLKATGCGLDIPPIIAIEAAPQVLPAAGALPSITELVQTRADAVPLTAPASRQARTLAVLRI